MQSISAEAVKKPAEKRQKNASSTFGGIKCIFINKLFSIWKLFFSKWFKIFFENVNQMRQLTLIVLYKSILFKKRVISAFIFLYLAC